MKNRELIFNLAVTSNPTEGNLDRFKNEFTMRSEGIPGDVVIKAVIKALYKGVMSVEKTDKDTALKMIDASVKELINDEEGGDMPEHLKELLSSLGKMFYGK